MPLITETTPETSPQLEYGSDNEVEDGESSSTDKPKATLVFSLFTCLDLMTQKWKCNHCGWTTLGGNVRRKFEHVLCLRNGSAKACSKHADVDLAIRETLLEELAKMDKDRRAKSKRKRQIKEATDGLTLPKRQRKLTFASASETDAIHMEFARMCIMSAVKSGFMESSFTVGFFFNQFNYTPPSRKQIMGPLLDAIYEDTKKKVNKIVNFADPDSFVTISMDGWQSPTGEHIRNYMWVTDTFTFFFDATNAGVVRPTGANIGAEAIKMIEATGAENVVGVTNDNASAETTSWDYIRDAYEKILCTGCTTHAGSLLFKDVCDHVWAQKLVKKATILAKFFRNHQYCNAEVRARTAAAHNGQSYAVILHGATRFAGFYYTVKRLVFLRTILREIAASEGFESRNFHDADTISDILNDTTFWSSCAKLRLFLKPLKCFIKLMDHDCNTTHHVYPGMYQINVIWRANEADVLTGFQKNALKELKYLSPL